MAYQHLRDAERLLLYAQITISDQKALSATLMEPEVSSRRWESEVQEAVERAVRVEVERDATWYEASMAKLDAQAVETAKA